MEWESYIMRMEVMGMIYITLHNDTEMLKNNGFQGDLFWNFGACSKHSGPF
jgi:hypothetical protein